MAEDTLWKGNPSQVTNLGHWIGIVVLSLIILAVGFTTWPPVFWLLLAPFAWALWIFLVVKCEVYELTTQRLRLHTGVINQKIDELELYRVKDITMERPLFLRIFGLTNIHLDTSDRSHPKVTLTGVREAIELREKLRKQVEQLRDEKRVREVDFDDDFEGAGPG